MARTLLTGAGSFTAAHCLDALRRAGETDLFGTDRTELGPPGLEYLPADVTDRDAVRRLLGAVRPDRVLHLAGVAAADRDLCFRVNLDGTRNLLEAAAALPAPPRVLVVSSSAVYGFSKPEESPLRETVPLRPVSAYGASKAAGEAAALSMHRMRLLRVTVARPFNLVGPGLGRGLAPADFLERILAIRRGESPPALRTGDLSARRDYVDGRDAALAYVALLERPDLDGGVFNVATGRAVAIAELVRGLLRAAGVAAELALDPSLLRPVEVREQTGDASALAAATGWTPAIDLEASLADMVAAATA